MISPSVGRVDSRCQNLRRIRLLDGENPVRVILCNGIPNPDEILDAFFGAEGGIGQNSSADFSPHPPRNCATRACRTTILVYGHRSCSVCFRDVIGVDPVDCGRRSDPTEPYVVCDLPEAGPMQYPLFMTIGRRSTGAERMECLRTDSRHELGIGAGVRALGPGGTGKKTDGGKSHLQGGLHRRSPRTIRKPSPDNIFTFGN